MIDKLAKLDQYMALLKNLSLGIEWCNIVYGSMTKEERKQVFELKRAELRVYQSIKSGKDISLVDKYSFWAESVIYGAYEAACNDEVEEVVEHLPDLIEDLIYDNGLDINAYMDCLEAAIKSKREDTKPDLEAILKARKIV